MSFLDALINIAISTQNPPSTTPGFGVPLIADAHTKWAERVRFYTEPDDMLADGFVSGDPGYEAAKILCSSNPQVAKFAIGRRANAPAIATKLVPTAQNSTAYAFNVNDKPVSYTSDANATVAEITAGLKTAIDALAIAGLTTTDNGTDLTITSAAGGYHAVSGVNRARLAVSQTHADPGIAADLDAIAQENGEWYGLALTTQGKAENLAAAAWAQANKRMFLPGSQDSECATHAKTGATDVAASIQSSGYTYAGAFFHDDPAEHIGAAVLGAVFPYDPGAATFMFKSLPGVTADTLSPTEWQNLKDKSANWYTVIGGTAITGEGKTGSGAFLDLTRDVDALHADMQSGIFAALVANPKIPFTDNGIGVIEEKVRASLDRFVDNGTLAKGSISISVPKAASVSSTDKSARKLRNVSWTAQGAGAIQGVDLKGNVTV